MTVERDERVIIAPSPMLATGTGGRADAQQGRLAKGTRGPRGGTVQALGRGPSWRVMIVAPSLVLAAGLGGRAGAQQGGLARRGRGDHGAERSRRVGAWTILVGSAPHGVANRGPARGWRPKV